MKHSTGVDYLICINGRYTVRVQIPKDVKGKLGKSEFKRAMGADFAVAKRNSYAVIADFQNQIEQARKTLGPVVSPHRRLKQNVSKPEIEAAVRSHYFRMVRRISEAGTSDRKKKIENLSEVIDAQLNVNAYEQWSAMSLDARWLCEENDWDISEDAPKFEHLCQALLRARLQAYRDEVRRLEGKRSQDPDSDPLFGKHWEDAHNAQSLGDLIDQFKSEKEPGWSVSTKANYRIIFRVLEEICGRDTPITSIDRKFCLGVRDTLLRLPSNYQKKPQTKNKPIAEVIAIGERLELPKMLPATINSHLSKLGAIIKVGFKAGQILGDPMADIEVPDNVLPRDKRDPFSPSQLNQIFASAPWCDGPGGCGEHPSRYWGPIIALFSGARLSEIFGQLVAEMVEDNGALMFDFRHRPDTRPMKNMVPRIVPVHPMLIELGFGDFVADARRSGREMLFPDARRDARGKWGDATSDWFARKIRRLNLKGKNLSFHSLRHNFEDALREAELHNTALGNELVGRWTPGTSKNYGKGQFSRSMLRKAMMKVEYPDLNLRHLRRC
jgi:integrase